MTKKVVCCAKDLKANTFGDPVFSVSLGVAIRGFTSAVNEQNAQSALYMYPDDFVLYSIGEWDDDEGTMTTWAPKQISLGAEVKVR